jgi:hypothetical protein
VRIGVELGLEESMAHFTGNAADIVVVVAETQVDRHVKAVRDGLGVVEPRSVLEVKVVIGGRVVVKVVADEKDLFDRRVE